MNPDSIAIQLAVVVERRLGITSWAEHVWRAVQVLEDAPSMPAWTLLRDDGDRALFFAGVAEARLHPTDTENYKHNVEAARPLVWVVLRPVESAIGFVLQTVTVDPGEAHLHADAGNDLVEALPMPPGVLALTQSFVARHHKERAFHKRRRDRADPQALARRGPAWEGDE